MAVPPALKRPLYRIAFPVLQVVWFAQGRVPSGVKCLLLDATGDVLLVRHTYGSREWTLPGGAIKRGEPPADTASREIFEELGVSVERWTALGEIKIAVGRVHATVHLFRGDVVSPVLAIDRGEIGAARWFPRTAVPSDCSPWLASLLELQ